MYGEANCLCYQCSSSGIQYTLAKTEFDRAHSAIKRGAGVQLPTKRLLNNVLNFPTFSLSSPKLRQSLKSETLYFAYDRKIS